MTKRLGPNPLTPAERQRRHRALHPKPRPKLRTKKPPRINAALRAPSGGVLRRILEAAAQMDDTRKHGGRLNLRGMTVLATGNDPYRFDHPTGHIEAQWFAEQVERFVEPDDDIHLRGLHYQISSVDDVRKPLTQQGKGQKASKGLGKPYRNTDEDWIWLCQRAANAARWLDLVPFERIRDERNAKPENFTDMRSPAEFKAEIMAGLPPDIELPDVMLQGVSVMPYLSRFEDGHAKQPYRLVIVGEKSSLDAVLGPIARRFNAELLLPTGESTTSMLWRMAARAARDPRPAALFYVSDYDPAGRQMPISAARKLQAMRDLKLPNLRIEVHHIALTREQCIEHNLPSTPLKETERRADKWRRIMGREQTEVDSLQALRPDVLRQIVTAALEPFYDETLFGRLEKAGEEWRKLCWAALMQHPSYEPWRERLTEAMERVEERMAPIREAMGPVEEAVAMVTELQAQANDELTRIEFPPFEVPMPKLNLEDSPEPLFTTSDDYATATRKLQMYKAMDGEGEED